MKRLLKWLVGTTAVVALFWSGGWLYFRSRVAAEIDRGGAELLAAGGAVTWTGRSIGGFPFALTVAWEGLVLRLPGGQAVTAPWLRGRAGLTDLSAVAFELPPDLALALPRGAGLPPASLRVTSEALRVRAFVASGAAPEYLVSAPWIALTETEPGPLDGLDIRAESPVIAVRIGPEGLRVMARADLATVAMTVPGPEATRQFATTLVTPALQARLALPLPADLSAALFGTGEAELRLDAEALSQEVIVRQPGRVATMRSDGEGLAALVALEGGNGRARLDFRAFRQRIDAGAPGVPPMEFSAAPAALGLALPLARLAEPSAFELRLSLDGLAASPEAWALIDAGAVLPRDPGTVEIDLAGTARWTVDPLALAETAPLPGARPFDLPTLAVNALDLRLAGASLESSGAAEMKPGDAAPLPVGTLDVRLEGGRGLLAKLREIGLVTPEAAFVANGYAALYTTPGEGTDVLLTEIGLGPAGLTFNGKPWPPAPPPAPVPSAE